jgi:hypothetical protein
MCETAEPSTERPLATGQDFEELAGASVFCSSRRSCFFEECPGLQNACRSQHLVSLNMKSVLGERSSLRSGSDAMRVLRVASGLQLRLRRYTGLLVHF